MQRISHQHLLHSHHQRITKIVTIQYTLMDWSNGEPPIGWKPLTQENFPPIKKRTTFINIIFTEGTLVAIEVYGI